MFKRQLKPIAGNETKAFCHYYNVQMVSEIMVLRGQGDKTHGSYFSLFKNSAKHVAQLKEFQEFCNIEPHKLLKPSQTPGSLYTKLSSECAHIEML